MFKYKFSEFRHNSTIVVVQMMHNVQEATRDIVFCRLIGESGLINPCIPYIGCVRNYQQSDDYIKNNATKVKFY